MALHFPLLVNGRTIGAFAAQRVAGKSHPDSICTYRVEIVQNKTGDTPRKGEHFFVEHRYGDGAFALVQKAIAEAPLFRSGRSAAPKRATEYDFHEVVRWAEAEGWELVNIAQQTRLSEQREQERQSEAAAKARWRSRAEAAEAAVARVEKIRAEAFRPGDDWHSKVVLEPHLAAALEGRL
ncbi:hypothetical protein P3H15_32665 [Rhodococcus sp. T2V]|uniref:hypothetical protein n=1 Tax=Rhodococcus sp. T2V TaxID=3034164 RepID=UPI0023E0F59E|nr:hypothetical protein [Rhodococcus sp. T2V]MDF3309773.1 hypothetical protein [Rhodococcus sp. T2V]